MRRLTASNINIRKLSLMAIFVNSAQIASAVFLAGILIFKPNLINTFSMRVLLVATITVTTAGALLDIKEAIRNRTLDEETDILEDSIDNLTRLNTEMRKQRHDFKNHLQVIYSLLELNEPAEARNYIDSIHSDLNRVGRILKTAHPAINALIAAKSNDAEESGVGFTVNVSSALETLPIPPYKLCRALGNLIDNAFDALIGQSGGFIRVSFEETQQMYRMSVSNNGPMIDQSLLEKIFSAGYSTKGAGRGMGLSVVSEIASSYGGALYVDSASALTKFMIEIPKKISKTPV